MLRRKFLALVLSAGLGCLHFGMPSLCVAGEGEPTIRGRVRGDGAPLARVAVSDGCRIVHSDLQGNYELPIGRDSGRFVFISTPRGWWTESFYLPLNAARKSGRADFELRAVDQPDRFDFVFLTDMHLGDRPWGPARFKATVREIGQLDPKPAFLLTMGDICLQDDGDKWGKLFSKCLAESEIPARNGAGNHEMCLEHPNPRDVFEKRFGPTYYSFEFGPLHMIVLDGNKVLPGRRGTAAVHGAVEGSQLAWLEADLAAQPKQKPVVGGVHIPIVTSWAQRNGVSNRDGYCLWESPNDRRLTDLFARRGVRLVLQGHMHENERSTVGGVEYVSSISICGKWWQEGPGFNRGSDECPRGYRVISVDGSRITHRYRPSCESFVDRAGEFMGLAAPVRSGKIPPLVYNCYDAPNGSKASGRVDGGPWQRMELAPHKSPPLWLPHNFAFPIERAALAPGRHVIEVRVTRPDGRVVADTKTIEVVR